MERRSQLWEAWAALTEINSTNDEAIQNEQKIMLSESNHDAGFLRVKSCSYKLKKLFMCLWERG